VGSEAAIIVTRPLQQAQTLARMIEAVGYRAILFPALEIIPKAPDPADQCKLDAADLAIFISANAVTYGLKYTNLPTDISLAAIGNATAAALQQSGYRNIIVPAQGFDSAALLSMEALKNVLGKHIAIFRGVGGRETLRKTLRQRGAKVEYIECYTRRCPSPAPAAVASLITRDDIAAIHVLSHETLENFCSMIGEKGVALLRQKPLFAPHPAILEGARVLGFGEGILTELGDAGLLAALENRFGLHQQNE
jgi:uroporphyrinogen-III synthase